MYAERDLPDNLDDCHKRIVTLEDAVQREVETQWNLLEQMRDRYNEEWVAQNRHKTMVTRLLAQIPREWIRKFIYLDDPHFTTIRRDTLEELVSTASQGNWEGEY